jgi:hypothetical protein
MISRICHQCSANYIVREQDLRLLADLSPTIGNIHTELPPPMLCPECRAARRYAWRSELHIHATKSDCSGKPMLSAFPAGSPCTVYANDEWWSDSWSPYTYGRDFDFSRPFFEQFRELIKIVPIPARSVSAGCENSDYTNCAGFLKNCYLLGGANYSEDCYYGNYVNRCRSCVDCNFIFDSELCYECVDCTKCYSVKYSYNTHGCSDSFFLHNCRECSYCFGCVNLSQKKYHFFNEALSPDEYHARLASYNLHTRSGVTYAMQQFEQFRVLHPYRAFIGEFADECVGNSINSSERAYYCFDVSKVRDCAYCAWLTQAESCMDIVSWGMPAELCYECAEAGQGAYRLLFCVSCYGSRDVMYSFFTQYATSCFGCVGLQHGEYVILNKQYSREAYEQLVNKIILHMKNTGEWGEFFPLSLCPRPYNTSIAQDYFPKTKEQVSTLGGLWSDESERRAPPSAIDARLLSDSIYDLGDDVTTSLYSCASTHRPFKLIQQEIQYYRNNQIPPPIHSFFSRHQRRLSIRPPRKLYERACALCHQQISTAFSETRPEKIYCQECYTKSSL